MFPRDLDDQGNMGDGSGGGPGPAHERSPAGSTRGHLPAPFAAPAELHEHPSSSLRKSRRSDPSGPGFLGRAGPGPSLDPASRPPDGAGRRDAPRMVLVSLVAVSGSIALLLASMSCVCVGPMGTAVNATRFTPSSACLSRVHPGSGFPRSHNLSWPLPEPSPRPEYAVEGTIFSSIPISWDSASLSANVASDSSSDRITRTCHQRLRYLWNWARAAVRRSVATISSKTKSFRHEIPPVHQGR